MMKNVNLFLCFFLVCEIAFSQTTEFRKCVVRNNDTVNYVTKQSKRVETVTGILRIPVVVHVLHDVLNGAIGVRGNISNEQIYSQIEVLNQDFRRLANTNGFNSNPVGADTEIEFFMAGVDNNCMPFNGITRHYNFKSNYNIYSDENEIKSFGYFPSNQYLNIWVASITGGILGMSPYPSDAGLTGIGANQTNEQIDGVIVRHNVFGNRIGTASSGYYSYGRTTTHEIGHWLGLIHIWGDNICGEDYCGDTPEVEGNNSVHNECASKNSNCGSVPVSAMIQNYMDYSDDICMNIFTQDQKTRMRTAMQNSPRRAALANSPAQTTLPIVSIPHIQNFENLSSLDGINWSQSTTFSGFNWMVSTSQIAIKNVLSTTGKINTLTTPFYQLPTYSNSNHVVTVNFSTKYPSISQTDSLVVSLYRGCNTPKLFLKSFSADLLSSAHTFRIQTITISGTQTLGYVKLVFEVFSKGIATLEIDNFKIDAPSNPNKLEPINREENQKLKCYYNQESNEIYAFVNSNDTSEYTFEIYDILGKKVFENSYKSLPENKYVLELKRNLLGVFIVRAICNNAEYRSNVLIFNK